MKKLLSILALTLLMPLTASAINVTVPQSGALGDTLYGRANGTYSTLPAGANGDCYKLSSGIPSWGSCGAGGGGGTDGNWSFFNGAGIRLATTSNQVVIGASATTSLAKLNVTGDVYVNGKIGIGTTTPYAPLSVVGQIVASYFTATSSTASTFPLASIAKLSNLTGNGFVKTSGGDGTLSIDTTTYESALTAGDGITRTVNDFDCDTASGSVFGCLSAANWTTFNNKQDTITAGDALTLTGTDIDFDGGATPAGDLGGTWASLTVTDDSHAHTGSTISGVDISSDTNLAVSGAATLTGDTIGVDTTGAWLGNAGTASALAANGTNCSAGSYPLGVDASGAVESCTVAASGGGAFPFTPTTNYAAATNATSSPVWFQAGLQASSTSHLVYASTTAASALDGLFLGRTNTAALTVGTAGNSGVLNIGTTNSGVITTNFKIGNDPLANYSDMWAGGVASPDDTNYAFQLKNDGSEAWFNATSRVVFSNSNTPKLEVLSSGARLNYVTGTANNCLQADAEGDITGTGSSCGGGSSASSTLLADTNTWSARNTFSNSSTTLASFSYASSTDLRAGTFTFGGVTGNSWDDFCTTITGSADLCDGGDASGGGGSIDGAGQAGMMTSWTDSNTVQSTSTIIGAQFIATSSTQFNTFAGTTTASAFQAGSTAIGSNVMKVGNLTGLTTSNSESVGGVFNMNTGTTDALGMALYNNHTGTNRLLSLICDAATYGGNCFHVRNDGTESAFNILCAGILGKGCGKLNIQNVSDADASILSLDASTAGYLGKGIFVDCTGGSCDPLATVLDVANQAGTNGMALTLKWGGNMGLGTTSPYARLSVVGETVSTNFTATSTAATSTIAGGLNVADAILYQRTNGNISIGRVAQSSNNGSSVTVFGQKAQAGGFAGGAVTITGGESSTATVGGNVIIDGGIGSSGTMNGNVLLATLQGNVGIATTSPYARLSVAGHVVAQNFTSTSTTAVNTFPNASTTDFTIAGVVKVPYETLSFTIASSTWGTGTTTVYLGPAAGAQTIQSVACETSAGTLGVSLYDGTNRATYIPTASTTANTNVFSTNNTFTKNESRRVDVGTAASSPTKLACTFKFTYTDDN